MLRKWLGFILIVIFVVTSVPTFSHASMSPNFEQQKVVKVEHGGKHHCCKDASKTAAAQKKVAKDNQCPVNKKSCCDKGSCKCFGNSCGAAKVLGFRHTSIPPVAKNATFVTTQDKISSSLSDRIKRPPRV